MAHLKVFECILIKYECSFNALYSRVFFTDSVTLISLKSPFVLFPHYLTADLCPQYDVSVWHVREQERHLSHRESTPPAGWQLLRVSESSQKRSTQYLCIQWPVIRYVNTICPVINTIKVLYLHMSYIILHYCFLFSNRQQWKLFWWGTIACNGEVKSSHTL